MLALRSAIARTRTIEGKWSTDDRFVDLALQLRVKETGKLSPIWGGRWDRFEVAADGIHGDYVGKADDVLVVEVSEQQYHVLMSKALHLLIIGGRRSGKTETLAIWAMMQLVQRPHKPLAILFKKMGKAKKFLFEKLIPKIPRHWLRPGSEGVKKSPYELGVVCINGAKLDFVSADRVDAPRGDGVAALGCDERQIIKREAWDNAFLSCSEGGDNFQTVETATALQGEFQEYYEECLKDEAYSVNVFRSRGNPFISHRIFDRARARLDPRRYAQEVEGVFTPQEGLVYWNFDKQLHVKQYNQFARGQDATRRLCESKFHAPGCDFIVGVDYGIEPFSCVVYKYLANGTLWAIDELIIDENADARTAAKELKDAGYFPALIIDDACDSRHGPDGKRWFKQFGFKVTSARRNPHVEDRCAAVRARLQNADGDVNLYFDPRCKRAVHAMLSQVYVRGKPDKELGFDHICDALGYPVARLFPVVVNYDQKDKRAAA